MKRTFAILLSAILLATAIVPLGLTASAANKAPTVIPAIRQWTGSSGSFAPNASTVLVNKNSSPAISKVSGFFEEMLGLKLTTSATADGNNEIVFTKDASLQSQVGKEGYTLTATTSKIEIKAPTDTGLLYGGITVVQSLTADGAFPCGSAVDYPEYEIRSGLIDVGRAWMPLDYVEEITRYMAYFKMNEIHVHINDDGKNYYSGFRLESDIKGLASKDGYYTKDEYRAYQKKMLEYGVTVITEIDTPFHASCYANAENPPPYLPDNYRCLDIRPEKFDETVAFVKKLLAEYMTGDDPVFVNKIVHIGTDEYPREYSEDMRRYTDTLIDYVNSLGYTPRFWGALGPNGFQGTTPISENAQMNFWDWRISGVEETLASDYDIINTLNEALYVVPTFGNYDRFNLKNLYNKWQVNYFNIDGTYQIDADDDRLLGACFGMWNDWHTEYIGITRFDIFDRLRGMVCLTAEKTWLGLATKNISADDFIARYEKLSLRAGDADPGRHSVPKEGLSVDFEGTLPEYVTLNGGKIENGAFVLDGTSYLSLTPDAIGFPNTLEFDIFLEEATTAPLFAGDGITISSNIDGKGNFGFKTEFYTFTYDYRLPTGVKTNIRLTSDINKATLIVNGRSYEPKRAVPYTSAELVLATLTAPLSEIGKGVKGYIDNIKVTPKVANENVALGAKATASSLEVNDGRFTADLAVDGDDSPASRLSFGRDSDEQWLLLDLGTSYSISEFEISFNEHVPSYEILVSEDGTTFTSVYKLTGGQNGGEATDKITLSSAVDAQYIKYVQLQRWDHPQWGKYSGGIKEFRAFSLGETNVSDSIVHGKEHFGAHKRSEYFADLTDGKVKDSISFVNEDWFGFYYHHSLTNEQNVNERNSNAPNGIGTIGFDLGGSYALSQVRVHTFLGNYAGISVPDSIALEISSDGETYTEVMRQDFEAVDANGANARAVDWVYFSFAAPESAKFVRLKFDLRDSATSVFINEIEVFGVEEKPEEPKGENVALGKDYEGGKASSAGGYTANLTDGVASDEEKYDANWFGLYYNKDATSDKINAPNGIGTIIVDLEEVVDGITGIKAHVWNHNASGISAAKSITAFISEDGTTYTELGKLNIPSGDAPDWAIINTDNVSARYVKLVIETQAVWTFLNEIEVIADPNYVPDDDTSEPETSDPEVSDPEVSEPETSEPESSEPEVSDPETSEPETSDPEVSDPEVSDPEVSDPETPDGKIADIDDDGDIDAADYVLVKRAVLKTYELSEKQKAVADVDKDDDVDATDYVLIKRIVLGTYKAKE